MKNTYETSHWGLGAFLTLVLGEESLVSTRKDGRRVYFLFKDEHPEFRCDYLATEFFSEAGAQVANARALLAANKTIAAIVREANHGV